VTVLLIVVAFGLMVAGSAAAATTVKSGPLAVGDEMCPGAGPPPTQLCAPVEPVQSFASSTPLSVVYTAPSAHCSNVIIHYFRDGHEVASTGSIPPSASSAEVSVPWIYDGQSHELGVEAEGQVSGCNEGFLHAWGGTIEVTYTPPPSGVKIEGSVLVADDKDIPVADTGVPGASVQISGPGGKQTVHVAANGHYAAIFKKAGHYTVFPHVPGDVSRGLRNPVKPSYRDVSVALGETATANFTVRDPLHLTIELSQDRVPADGFHTVQATITATALGKPVKDLDVSIRPFEGQSLPVYEVPVPAAICLRPGNRRIWPDGNPSANTRTGPVDERTDAAGQIRLDITVGTVPGPLKLEAWAADSTGALNTSQDILDVSPEATLTADPLGGSGGFEAGLAAALRTKPSLTLPTAASALADTLGLITSQKSLGSFNYAPIKSSGGKPYEAVLIYSGGTRISFAASGDLAFNTTGVVLSGTNFSTPEKALGDLTAIARSKLPALPSFETWLSGASLIGYEFPGISGPATEDLTDYTFFGYGYPSARSCS
jgi:hypothetical protein